MLQYTPERELVELFRVLISLLKMGGMWLSKVRGRGENLVQYLKISLDIVLDAKSFDASGKSDF